MEFIGESFTLDLKTTLVDFLRVGVGACGFMLIAKHTPGADADTPAASSRGCSPASGSSAGVPS